MIRQQAIPTYIKIKCTVIIIINYTEQDLV